MQEEKRQRRHADYLDFDLEIGVGTGREYPVSVLDSPAGQPRTTMLFPFDELALENRLLTLQNALLRSGGALRRTLSPEEQKVQDFGRELFEALFAPGVRSCYDVSLREAEQARKGLRLRLRIQAPELAALPWEYLYHPDQAEYLSLSTQTPIVRYLEVPKRIQPLTVRPPLRILGMIASPIDMPRLDTERERQRMEQATRKLSERGSVSLTWLAGQGWRDLMRALRQGTWHIFHFVGHGAFDRHTGEGLIVLADEEGRAARFHATRLGRLLADHPSLRLVLLNSCEGAQGSERDIFSSSAAVLVRRGIPAVLAMQYEITDRAAIEFAYTFYEAVGDGMPVDGAVAEARKAVSFAVTNTVEWGTPVLYMRSPDGVLFQISEAQQVERPAQRVPEVPRAPAEELEEVEGVERPAPREPEVPKAPAEEPEEVERAKQPASREPEVPKVPPEVHEKVERVQRPAPRVADLSAAPSIKEAKPERTDAAELSSLVRRISIGGAITGAIAPAVEILWTRWLLGGNQADWARESGDWVYLFWLIGLVAIVLAIFEAIIGISLRRRQPCIIWTQVFVMAIPVSIGIGIVSIAALVLVNSSNLLLFRSTPFTYFAATTGGAIGGYIGGAIASRLVFGKIGKVRRGSN